MVKINNQHSQAFLDMLAWSEDVYRTSENQKSWILASAL